MYFEVLTDKYETGRRFVPILAVKSWAASGLWMRSAGDMLRQMCRVCAQCISVISFGFPPPM